ncbi:hypothetical protein NMY22_g8168 [Coprinellus aureogranulatus]|nr:hypothetical protein NMY22_g8168 [Coprinellus aureogranulatus]
MYPEWDAIPPHRSLRHNTPSDPWPWLDIEDEIDRVSSAPLSPSRPCYHLDASCSSECWRTYPQSLFANWRQVQMEKSRVLKAFRRSPSSPELPILRCHLTDEGFLEDSGELQIPTGANEGARAWEMIKDDLTKANTASVQSNNLSGPIMQMLGAKWYIEPIFFSSSINWIPSRFMVKRDACDHLSVTLKYVRVPQFRSSGPRPSPYEGLRIHRSSMCDRQSYPGLEVDLLSVYLIRKSDGAVILSYHDSQNLQPTRAKTLHERMRVASHSAHWREVLQSTKDPILVLILLMWHAFSCWEEALELLSDSVNLLGKRIRQSGLKMHAIHRGDAVRAYHAQCISALDDFSADVEFIRNAAASWTLIDKSHASEGRSFVQEEAQVLLSQVDKLKRRLRLQEEMIGLSYHLTDAHTSLAQRKYSEVTVEESKTMKAIARLTALFLPASFLSAIFGMNVGELSPEGKASLWQYVAAAIPLTLITIRVVSAMAFTDELDTDFWMHVTHPFGKMYMDHVKPWLDKLRKRRVIPRRDILAETQLDDP